MDVVDLAGIVFQILVQEVLQNTDSQLALALVEMDGAALLADVPLDREAGLRAAALLQRGQQLPVLQAVLLMLIQMRHDIAFIFIAHAFVAAHQRIIDLLFHSHAHYLLTAAAHPSAAAHVPSLADSASV